MSAHFSGRALCVVLLLTSARFAAASGDLRVVDAVKNRDAKAVAALVKQRADVNAAEPDGATALHWAAHLDDVNMIDTLIRAGARPNVTNDYGVTPLMLASENGSAAVIKRLLQGGANANATMPSGETPLMTAARTGRVDAVIALVAGGADVNAKEHLKQQTALMWALSGQYLDTARALLERGADVRAQTSSGFTPLMFAARYGSIDAVRLLIANGADLQAAAEDGATPLIVAVLRGHIDLAKFLLDQGADPNADATGYTALHYAAGKWDGVDAFHYIDAPGEWGILLGLRPADKLALIKDLLAHGANPDVRLKKEPPRYGFSLVSGSAKRLTAGATPFYLAAMSGDLDVMRLLLAGGADPKIRSANGSTAVMVAAGLGWMENETLVTEKEYLPAVELAIEMGVDVNAANDSGETALHATISGGFDTIVQRLAERGANLNAKDRRGNTPLKMALGYGAAGGTHVREKTAALLRKLGGTE